MKTVLLKLFAVVLAVATLGGISLAQNSKRIDFAKEGCCLVWEEKVPANSSKMFVFYAKRGQKLSLNFIDDTKVGSMDLGKISIEPNADPFEMTIEVSKDYLLSVSNNSSKPTSFRIFISLENTKASNIKREKVQFAKGKTDTALTRDIPANGSIDFIINAKKGQTMGFTVGYDFKDSDVEAFLTEPTVQDISLSSGPKKPNEFVVQITGDHRLTVTNKTGKKITITLYLDIK